MTTAQIKSIPIEHIFGKEVEVHPKGKSAPIVGLFCGKTIVDEWSKDLRLFKIDVGNGTYVFIAPLDVSYIVVHDFSKVSNDEEKTNPRNCSPNSGSQKADHSA